MSNFLFALAASFFVRRRYVHSHLGDVLALAAALLAALTLGDAQPAHVRVGLGLGAAGLVSVLHMLLRQVSAPAGSSVRTQMNTALLVPGGLLLFLVVIGVMLPAVSSFVSLETYDRALAELDVALFGALPAAVVAGWLEQSSILNFFVHLSYASLMLLVGISCVGKRLPLALIISAALGYLCYMLVPACGPKFAMASWPAVPVLSDIPLELDAVHVRNCMPSLHLTTALLLFYNAARLSVSWRWIVALNVPLTVLATLGLGEHYATDLIAALPFSLLCWFLAARLEPWLRAAMFDFKVRIKVMRDGYTPYK